MWIEHILIKYPILFLALAVAWFFLVLVMIVGIVLFGILVALGVLTCLSKLTANAQIALLKNDLKGLIKKLISQRTIL